MRRLVVESSAIEVANYLGIGSSLSRLDSFEVLSFLKEQPNEVAMICRVRFKEGTKKIDEVLAEPSAVIQHLDRESSGAHVYYIKRKPLRVPSPSVLTAGGYLTTFELKDGVFRVGFLGGAKEVGRFLRLLRRMSIQFKVASLTDAKFSSDSPLGKLTDKQRKVLTSAYRLGYYDLPKRINSEDLAHRLGMRSSTMVVHRIKAERRILAALLNA